MFRRSLVLMKKLTALNVAEKPSVARTLTDILSKRNYEKTDSFSKYNPVFNFEYKIKDDLYKMNFTSVTGHMMNFEFETKTKWVMEEIKDLFSTKINKLVSKGSDNIYRNLDEFGKNADVLILWLDCDREGENIAFEVIDVVKNANPNVKVFRARFSALTEKDITYSISNLVQPDKNISDAVELRSKIDLLIGSAFTRLQSLSFKNLLPIQHTYNAYSKLKPTTNVISYGPCQFPTLNFVVERSEKIEKFKEEEFHFLELIINKENQPEVKFNWKRERLFDKDITRALYEIMLADSKVKITQVTKNPKVRYRPVPLNTVELTKLVSRKLKIASHVTMDVAEKLYQKGYISYPRTETQKYAQSEVYSLKKVLSEFGKGKGYDWCEYAGKLSFNRPRDGKSDDKSHPPIHPVRFVEANDLTDYEKKIYNLLVLHFLATVSPNAEGEETTVELTSGGEEFSAKGVTITQKGFLEIYPYDNWTESVIPPFKQNEEFSFNNKSKSVQLLLKQGMTTPPFYLSEAELISLMDKFGIGTDATIHEHIKHIQERGYAKQAGSVLRPTIAGIALIKAYEKIGVELYKPNLRAAMEKDMKAVSEGKRKYQAAYNQMKKEMERIFDTVYANVPVMTEFLKNYLGKDAVGSQSNPGDKKSYIELNVKCATCKEHKMKLIKNKTYNKYFVGCSGFPECKAIVNIKNPINAEEVDKKCPDCKAKMFELEYKEGQEKELVCLTNCLKQDVVNDTEKKIAERLKNKKSISKSYSSANKKPNSNTKEETKYPKKNPENKLTEEFKSHSSANKKTNSNTKGETKCPKKNPENKLTEGFKKIPKKGVQSGDFLV